MSLYNLVQGMSPLAGPLLGALGLSAGDVGRFRDVFLNVEEGEPVLGVFTRNGGGNRSDYQEVFARLRKHPLYLRDADEEYDNTYAMIWFKVPGELREELLAFVKQHPYVSPGERFQKVLDGLRGG